MTVKNPFLFCRRILGVYLRVHRLCPVEDRIVWLSLTDGHKRKYMAAIYGLWHQKELSTF